MPNKQWFVCTHKKEVWYATQFIDLTKIYNFYLKYPISYNNEWMNENELWLHASFSVILLMTDLYQQWTQTPKQYGKLQQTYLENMCNSTLVYLSHCCIEWFISCSLIVYYTVRARAHQWNWQPQRNRNFRELLDWVEHLELNWVVQIEEMATQLQQNLRKTKKLKRDISWLK